MVFWEFSKISGPPGPLVSKETFPCSRIIVVPSVMWMKELSAPSVMAGPSLVPVAEFVNESIAFNGFQRTSIARLGTRQHVDRLKNACRLIAVYMGRATCGARDD